MQRAEAVRSEVYRLLRAAPFRSFSLNVESGDRVIIEHLENIAFDPGGANGKPPSEEFYVISGSLRHFGTFSAVTSVAMLDRGQ
jgi:hypothetical protein